MIVRCGKCKVDLEVDGPGEFVCPSCGTRNAVRAPAAASPFGLPDLGAAAPPAQEIAVDIRWVRCPGCSYRFALGEVESFSCPACSRQLVVSDDGVREVPAS